MSSGAYIKNAMTYLLRASSNGFLCAIPSAFSRQVLTLDDILSKDRSARTYVPLCSCVRTSTVPTRSNPRLVSSVVVNGRALFRLLNGHTWCDLFVRALNVWTEDLELPHYGSCQAPSGARGVIDGSLRYHRRMMSFVMLSRRTDKNPLVIGLTKPNFWQQANGV